MPAKKVLSVAGHTLTCICPALQKQKTSRTLMMSLSQSRILAGQLRFPRALQTPLCLTACPRCCACPHIQAWPQGPSIFLGTTPSPTAMPCCSRHFLRHTAGISWCKTSRTCCLRTRYFLAAHDLPPASLSLCAVSDCRRRCPCLKERTFLLWHVRQVQHI